MSTNMNEKIKETLKCYASIIDFDDNAEVFGLIADLTELFNKREAI